MEILKLFYAWKTADVSRCYGETATSMYTLYSQLQAWVLGIPILVVIDGVSVDAVFVGRALLIWIFSISGICFVIGPKIFKAMYERRYPEETSRGGNRVHVSGIRTSASSAEAPGRLNSVSRRENSETTSTH